MANIIDKMDQLLEMEGGCSRGGAVIGVIETTIGSGKLWQKTGKTSRKSSSLGERRFEGAA
jgi:hypothetical protein